MDQTTLQELKTSLEQERDRVVASLSSIAKPDSHMKGNWNADYPQFEATETGSHNSLDQEADEVEEYEARLEAEHSLESRLLHITRALTRIQAGTYGICAACKKPLPLDRLKANPAAESHVEHKK